MYPNEPQWCMLIAAEKIIRVIGVYLVVIHFAAKFW